MKYCNSLTKFSRFKTRVVKIGDLKVGLVETGVDVDSFLELDFGNSFVSNILKHLSKKIWECKLK